MFIAWLRATDRFGPWFVKTVPLSAGLFGAVLWFFPPLSATPPDQGLAAAPDDPVASIDRDTSLLLCLRADPSLSRTVADCEAPVGGSLDQ